MSTKTKFYKLLIGLLFFSSVSIAQNNSKLLEFTLNHLTEAGTVAGSGFGPRTTNHVVFFDKDKDNNGKMDMQSANPDPISSPFISATISLQNQQYTGFTYGTGSPYPISTGLVFGAAPSTAFGGPPPQQVEPLNSYDLLGAFYAPTGGGPRNGMFMSYFSATPVANFPGASGTGIDAEGLLPSPATDANGGVEVFTAAQRMFDLSNAAGTANRYYYGDLVITFSRWVTDPVIHIAGLGGSYRYSLVGTDPTVLANWRSTFFSTELELVSPSNPLITFTKMAGNQFLAISGKNILNNATTPNGESIDVGAVALPNWNNFGAATGSIRINGSPVLQLRFKVWLRGSDANALPAGFNWSAPGAASGGSRDPLTGDIWYVGVTLPQPSLLCIPGSPGCTLPSTGVRLEAALNGNDVALSWKTESEINSDHFEIERSTDGINFTQIGSKQAAGNSITTINYSYADPNMSASVYYYRLKLVDADGQYKYSNIAIVRKPNGIKGVRVFPNPVTDQVNLEFLNAKGNYDITFFNQSGQKVMNRNANVVSTVQYVNMARGSLPPGSYIISARNTETNEKYVQNVIIQ
ncbi:MAG: T9SS type A sorting domain-containing protein [Chitinophagaceae bacterium]